MNFILSVCLCSVRSSSPEDVEKNGQQTSDLIAERRLHVPHPALSFGILCFLPDTSVYTIKEFHDLGQREHTKEGYTKFCTIINSVESHFLILGDCYESSFSG